MSPQPSDAANEFNYENGASQSATSMSSLLDEISTTYRYGQVAVENRRNKRVEFTDDIRVCLSDRRGVPIGHSFTESGRNISLWGVSFCTTRHFDIGSHLTLELLVPVGETGSQVTMLADVRHVTKGEDGLAVVGCRFVETLVTE